MKIYTKRGDKGETDMLGRVRIPKDHICVEVCGTLDELNSILGVALAGECPEPVSRLLVRLQSDLFDLGGWVAASLSGQSSSQLDSARVGELETQIDELETDLPPLKAFIMPGGDLTAGQLHLARTVCRRAERRLVSLATQVTDYDFTAALTFLNRLGDYLFVAARSVNHMKSIVEPTWIPHK